MNKRMYTPCWLLFTLVLSVGIAWDGMAQENQFDPARWEEDIQAFKKADQQSPPQENGILFLGSSSIRMWDLDKHFPGKSYINRGFGGSHMEDVVYYADQIVLPYKPRLIFLYEGDNDIAGGKTPQRVLADFQRLVNIVHHDLPNTEIVFLAIKTSPKRWDKHVPMRQANELIQNYTRQFDFLHYLDTDAALWGDGKKPNPNYFKNDMLHLNEKGYPIWTELVNKFLQNQEETES
ncbi:hypothetical protein GF373_03140 [bacterium]|nr:hypothetical protein [bacterium]